MTSESTLNAETEYVEVRVDAGVATIMLDRPPVNAMNMQLCRDIATAFAAVNRAADARAAILTASGKCFCAGKDLKVADHEPQDQRAAALAAAMSAVFHCRVPVVAAVNGPAIGAGFRLLLQADIIIASSKAVFAMPEIDIGLVASVGTLLRGISAQHAREIALTGRRFSAEEMHAMGLLQRVETVDGLLPRAYEIAAKLASKDPAGLCAAKWSSNEVEFMFADFEAAQRAIEERAWRS